MVNNKIEGIQALRIITYLWILCFHCGANFLTGAFGVCIFFVLSGFCMQLSYNSNKKKPTVISSFQFAKKKVEKLYVSHIILIFLFLAVNGFHDWTKSILCVFFLQVWIPNESFVFSGNMVAWWLSVYVFLCFCAPTLLYYFNQGTSNKRLVFIGAYIYIDDSYRLIYK